MDFCEFLSEDELIEIVPNFKYDRVLNLINGDFGPFVPAVPLKVPLWMALNLYGQQKCKINLPQWVLDIDQLRVEQENSPGLIKMPCDYWREVSKLLMKYQITPTSFTEEHLRIVERRDNIIKNSVKALLDGVINLDEDQIARVKIKNITKFELAMMKKIILPYLAISKDIQRYPMRI